MHRFPQHESENRLKWRFAVAALVGVFAASFWRGESPSFVPPVDVFLGWGEPLTFAPPAPGSAPLGAVDPRGVSSELSLAAVSNAASGASGVSEPWGSMEPRALKAPEALHGHFAAVGAN